MSLKDCLLRLGISFEKCRGQAYDGASNYQGYVNGVARRFLNDNSTAIPVHCLAHYVNLSLQEVSPKHQITFEIVQEQQESPTTSGIGTLCPTRWTVRTGAIQAIINNYAALQETMELSSHGTDDCSRRAGGMPALMDTFSTYFWSQAFSFSLQYN